MSFRKILCSTDFSRGSEEALTLAAQLATASNAALVISHAWFVPPLAYAGESWVLSAEVVDNMVQDAELGLATAVARASGLGVANVTSLLLNGRPDDLIVGTLRDDPAYDLVVIGTHGRTGLQRVLLGSVAENVVRHAPCSVLVARPRLQNAAIRNVLCPVDFSDSSHHALDMAVELVTPGGAGITLLHSIELPARYSEDPTLMTAIEEIDARTTQLLEQWAHQARGKTSAAVTLQTQRGGSGGQILAALEQGTFDLVVMGSHGRTGIRRALLGSVAEKVVRHAACPVLVGRARA